MYKRNENIEDDNLEWEDQDKQHSQTEDVKVSKPLVSPKIQDQSALLEEYKGLNHNSGMKRKTMTILDENITLFSIVGLLVFPYLLGFLITFLLYSFYGGMTISSFFFIDKDYLPLQLWSIGAYLFVTAWLIWAFFQNLTRSS